MTRLAVVALLLLALAGCGGDDAGPAAVVPPDATLYVSADLAPEGAARELLGSSPAARLFELAGVDVQPAELDDWVGDRGAFFTRGPDVGLAVEVRDDDDAKAFARRVSAGDRLSAFAIIDGYVQIEGGRLTVNLGQATGGVAGDLPETPAFRDAARRLGGAPTAFLDLETTKQVTGWDALPDGRYLAVRDAAAGGRRVLRIAYAR
jgi:hypothetical protein